MKNIYLLAILWVFCINGNAQQWKAPEFGNIQPIETYGLISDIIEWKDTLYAAGYFRNQFGDTIKGIGKFNGSKWVSVLNSDQKFSPTRNVKLLIYKNNLLITNSSKLYFLGKSYPGLIQFNGKSIYEFDLDSSFSGIDAIYIKDTNIYISHFYSDSIAGIYSPGVAKWDGKKWNNMGKGFQNSPDFIFNYNNQLHVASSQKLINDSVDNWLAYWNNNSWKDYRFNESYNFLPCCIYGIVVYNNKILLNRGKNELAWFTPYEDTVFKRQNYKFPNQTKIVDNFLVVDTSLYYLNNKMGFFKYKNKNDDWKKLIEPITSPNLSEIISLKNINNTIWACGNFNISHGAKFNYLSRYDNSATTTENKFGKNQNFSIFPNPSNQKFTIEGNTQDIDLIRIYNISGQLITEKKGIELSNIIDLKDVPKGLYFVTIHTKFNTVEHNKIIIN